MNGTASHDYILGRLTNGGLLTLSENDLRHHAQIIGKSGTGKSALLESLMLSDLANDRGFALIDPHGDLALKIADSIPPDRRQHAVYLDPLDPYHVPSFNPLIDVPALHRGTLAARIVSAFKHIWHESWGPRLDYILTNAIRLLLENKGTTLVSLPLLLSDGSYRRSLLRKCDDPFIRAFWEGEFDNYPDRFKAEAVAPIQNKVGQFANNPILRAIIGQARSTFDIARIMNEGKILIANLSKAMGEEPSHLLGALLTTAIAQAAELRAVIPERDRRHFTLYVDEFQNFATTSFVTILSESRKFGLSVVLANQFLGQIPELLQQAVLGNVGTLIVFRIGAEDAPLLARELGMPNENTLIATSNHCAWIKRLSFGSPSSPILIATIPPQPQDHRKASGHNQLDTWQPCAAASGGREADCHTYPQ